MKVETEDSIQFTVKPDISNWLAMKFQHYLLPHYLILLTLFLSTLFYVYNTNFMITWEIFSRGHSYGYLIALIIYVAIKTKLTKKLRRRNTPSTDSYLFQPTHYKCTADSIEIDNDTSSTHYKWMAIRNITEDTKNLYLWTDNLNAHIIPKLQLDDPSETTHQIQNWFNAAHSLPIEDD